MPKRRMNREALIQREHLQQITQVRPDLVIEEVEHNRDGMLNDIVIINSNIIFRFPRYTWVLEDMEQERICLEFIQDRSNLAVPVWRSYDQGFISYEAIPGIPLSRNQLLQFPRKDQQAIAEQLALFLRNMHHLPGRRQEAGEVKRSLTYQSYNDWLSLLDELQQELFPFLSSYMQDQIEEIFHPLIGDNTFMDCREYLIHGDLRSYHILYDPDSRRITGIIDFGSAGLGDPAYDISSIINDYGEGFAALISRHYPGIKEMIDRARFWALTSELQWALAGVRTQDPSWFLVHLTGARDISPLGSPLLLTGSGDLR